jgi:hypothetical protein
MSTKKNFIERLSSGNLFRIDQGRGIDSLKALTRVIFIFTLLFPAAYCVKMIGLGPDSIKPFKLVISNINILPLYKADFTNFIIVSVFEILRLSILALIFFYLMKFLNSLDKVDPFRNIRSKDYIGIVAGLGVLFFGVDCIGSMHLSYFQEELMMKDPIRIFHFEYLFITYFLNVFAFIFKKGVDLNNEIELVI